MQNNIEAEKDGKVTAICVKPGQAVLEEDGAKPWQKVKKTLRKRFRKSLMKGLKNLLMQDGMWL